MSHREKHSADMNDFFIRGKTKDMEALQRHGAPMTAQIYYIFLNGHAFPSFKLKLYWVNNSCLRFCISIPFASWPDSLNYRLNCLNCRPDSLSYRPDIGKEERNLKLVLPQGECSVPGNKNNRKNCISSKNHRFRVLAILTISRNFAPKLIF